MAVPIETIDLVADGDDDVVVLPSDIPDNRSAEARKEQGNNQFKRKKYDKALIHYNEAIKLCPEAACYYGNRAACYLMMGQYKRALEDSKKSVDLDSKFVKGYLRLVKCYIALGDTASAEKTLRQAEEIEPANAAIKTERNNLNTLLNFIQEADKALKKNDYRTVVYNVDRALLQATHSTSLKLLKAECLAYLNRTGEAQELANDAVNQDKQNADAIFVLGLCQYYQNNIDRALPYFQHVLRLAPDHQKSKDMYKKAKLLQKLKEDGNNSYKSGKLPEALKAYTDALAVDPLFNTANAVLYSNRAAVSQKLGKLEDAIADCTQALKLDETYLKPLLRRAQCYQGLNEHEKAVADFEKAYKQEKTRENRNLYEDAKLTLKKSKRKDYYKILGIDKNASTDEIKKAYRKRALVHHPDRHANASENEKKEQEKKFKEVGEAYGILSDPTKRMRYDSGQDLDDACSPTNIDPTQMFQTFYGGDRHNFSFHSNAFPSDFTFYFK
ncbi:dnaJ homolog subfamily C member 7 [Bemisia tabaci]|nr:PREDICTED: dnaJ homolog subfamily C member 7 [Bemisia tabaci]